mgnify:FL=1
MATSLIYDKETGRLAEFVDNELLNTEHNSVPF